MLSDQMSRGYKTSVDCLPTANTLVNLKSNTMKNTLQIYVK